MMYRECTTLCILLQCQHHRLRGHVELLHRFDPSTNGLPFGERRRPRVLLHHPHPSAVQTDQTLLRTQDPHSDL